MHSCNRDSLFEVFDINEDFAFNDRVVEVFDDMIDRSVPYYKDVIKSSSCLLEKFLQPDDTVYDLGCSTGSSLFEIVRLLPELDVNFVGIDNSRPMLEKAKLKAELYKNQGKIAFKLQDILEFGRTAKPESAGAVILNYTLQFIRPLQRETFIKQLFNVLRPGGILLISEKIINNDPRLNREFINIYHRFKRSKGYSELEIAKKREALENVLIPFSIQENKDIFLGAGFLPVETFFQWFNFCSFLAVKPE